MSVMERREVSRENEKESVIESFEMSVLNYMCEQGQGLSRKGRERADPESKRERDRNWDI